MIAVDVMGGDFAPKAIVEGAFCAAEEGVPVLLFGPKPTVIAHLTSLRPEWGSLPITIEEARDVIGMNDEPVRAVREKSLSSIVLAVKSAAEGRSCAVVSAGNSGALMVAATLILGRVRGVERSPIAGFLPGIKRPVLGLDLGANTECKPSFLEQFAYLGSAYAEKMLRVEKPTVALLSNGREENKGSLLVKEAYKLLVATNLNFIGNVEPKEIVSNNVDVVVCDGLTGNVLLKTFESVAQMFKGWFSDELEKLHGSNEDCILKWGQKFLDKIICRSDWMRQGGAALLGTNGTVIVAHGCSNSSAIKNAIKLAWKLAQEKAVEFKFEGIDLTENHSRRMPWKM